MQLSELYRRGIVSPKDDEAEAQMRCWDVSEGIEVDFLSIPGHEFFYEIWKAGVFDDINESCGTFVDDYEEDMMEADQLGLAISALDRGQSSNRGSRSVAQFRKELVGLMQRAEKAGRPVFFVL